MAKVLVSLLFFLLGFAAFAQSAVCDRTPLLLQERTLEARMFVRNTYLYRFQIAYHPFMLVSRWPNVQVPPLSVREIEATYVYQWQYRGSWDVGQPVWMTDTRRARVGFSDIAYDSKAKILSVTLRLQGQDTQTSNGNVKDVYGKVVFVGGDCEITVPFVVTNL